MISSAEIDVGNAIRHYGMKSVLEAMILYLGYEDYEINLRIALRTALEQYENRYVEKEITCAIPPLPSKKYEDE